MLWQLLKGYKSYGGPEVENSRGNRLGQLDEVKCGSNLDMAKVTSLSLGICHGRSWCVT